MYATDEGIRRHAQLLNVSLKADDIAHGIQEGDNLVDSSLDGYFEMPLTLVNGEYPAILSMIAEHFGAAIILEAKLAISSQGASDNSLTERLHAQAEKWMNEIQMGKRKLPGQVRLAGMPTRAACNREGAFRKVRQLGSTGSGG